MIVDKDEERGRKVADKVETAEAAKDDDGVFLCALLCFSDRSFCGRWGLFGGFMSSARDHRRPRLVG